MCITLFCTFLSRRCTVPNFTLCRGREQKTTIFFFFSWTFIQSFRIQLQRKSANIWRIKRDGISAISHHRPCEQESLTHPSQKFSNLICWKYSISEQTTLINSYFSALHDVSPLVIICNMQSLMSEWLASMMVLKASSKFDQR